MSNLKNPISITANKLLDGEAVWLGSNGHWVKSVDSARAFFTEEERKIAEHAAARADAENLVVEPYEIEVKMEEGAPVPLKFRERIRAQGPTIRLDLGKQAVIQSQAAAA